MQYTQQTRRSNLRHVVNAFAVVYDPRLNLRDSLSC